MLRQTFHPTNMASPCKRNLSLAQHICINCLRRSRDAQIVRVVRLVVRHSESIVIHQSECRDWRNRFVTRNRRTEQRIRLRKSKGKETPPIGPRSLKTSTPPGAALGVLNRLEHCTICGPPTLYIQQTVDKAPKLILSVFVRSNSHEFESGHYGDVSECCGITMLSY